MDQTSQNVSSQSKEKKNVALKVITIIFTIIFIVVIALAIAYIADFLIYQGSHKDGLLWTANQRAHGLFNLFNK
ncbi:hypothetical protein KQ874_00475 [Mycoplasma sp. ES3157-GEN-MYC]|uniref:hypothetical protein n=1 Tax=Mycoplasma miroungigenitalium TaxID=754515 RepID=UPI001C0FE4F4|nr:hypothetical protein [Mycoplasma miroungigenitalium]MBU4690180.1 hypothetical protein [Mycoplasma miroungigenitalium]